jgi:hypothetical protein
MQAASKVGMENTEWIFARTGVLGEPIGTRMMALAGSIFHPKM